VQSKAARSPEELFPLLDFCHAGKLKEVGEWIEARKPLDPPLNVKKTRRQSPLEIAIDKGFEATDILDYAAAGRRLIACVRKYSL